MSDDATPSAALPPELASAYVDGEASADERARVEADPELLDLVAVHAAVRDAVAAPVAGLTEADRDALITTALAAAPPTSGGTVVPLTAGRRARSRRLLPVVAGGMAAIAAVVLLGLVIARSGTDGNGSNASSGTEAQAEKASADSALAASGGSGLTDSAAGAATTAAAGEGAPAGAQSPATEAPASSLAAAPGPAATAAGDASRQEGLAGLNVEDLGPLADRNEFIAAVRRFATTTPAAGTGPCADYPPPLATATFKGTPAYLVVIEAVPAGNRLALVAVGTCTVLVKVDLAE